MFVQLSFRSLILFFLAILILLPPFFNGGRHFLVLNSLLVAAGLLLLFFIFAEKKKTILINKKNFVNPYFFWLFFLVLSFISFIKSIALYQSGLALFQLVSYAVIFFIVSQSKFSSKQINFLIYLLIAVAFALSLIGIYYYLTGHYYRLTSTFYWANPFAGYLLLVLPLAVIFFYSQRSNSLVRNLSIIILPILFSSFFLTQSRGAFLSLSLAIIVYLPIFIKKIKKEPMVWLLTIVLISVAFIIFLLTLKFDNPLFNQSKAVVQGIDISSKTRIDYWISAAQIFLARPLTGFGPETFSLIYPAYQRDAISSTKYAHNYFLQLLAEEGGLAATVFILILLTIFWPAIKTIKQNQNVFGLGFLIGLSASIIHSLVDVDWHFPANFIVFWILAGLLYNVCCFNEERKINLKFGFFLLLLVAFILIIRGIFGLQADYHFQKAKKAISPEIAESQYRTSLFLNPNPDYYSQLSQVLFVRALNEQNETKKSELLAESESIINKAIKLNHRQSFYYFLKANIDYIQNEKDSVEENLKSAIRLDPINRPLIYIALINFYLENSRFEEAKIFAGQILSKYPESAIARQEWKNLIGPESLTQIRHDISLIYYLRGMANLRIGDRSAAKVDFQKALEVDQNNNWAKIEFENIK